MALVFEMNDTWNQSSPNDSSIVTSSDGTEMQTVRAVCELWLAMPIAIVGILGNIISFIVLCFHNRKQTTITVLQALTIADTCVLLLTLLLRSFRYLDIPSYMIVYHHIFRWLYPMAYFLRLVDTWFSVLLTVDRYIVVCHPLHAQRLCTRRRTLVLIVVIVIASFLFSFPRYFEYKVVEFEVNPFGFETTDLLSSQSYTIAYRIVLFFVFMYLLPMTLLVTLNVRLLVTLSKSNVYRSLSVQRQTSAASSGNLESES